MFADQEVLKKQAYTFIRSGIKRIVSSGVLWSRGTARVLVNRTMSWNQCEFLPQRAPERIVRFCCLFGMCGWVDLVPVWFKMLLGRVNGGRQWFVMPDLHKKCSNLSWKMQILDFPLSTASPPLCLYSTICQTQMQISKHVFVFCKASKLFVLQPKQFPNNSQTSNIFRRRSLKLPEIESGFRQGFWVIRPQKRTSRPLSHAKALYHFFNFQAIL